MRNLCFTSMLLIYLSTQLYSQTWPIGTQNDLSSPFGSRNLGSQNFPNSNYDYDFHRGVDIARTGSVRAAYGGTVIALLQDVNQQTGVVIKDSYDEFEAYFHIAHNLMLNQTVSEGDVIGTVQLNHLDFKFYPLDYKLDEDAEHPMWILPYTDAGTNFKVEYERLATDNTGQFIEISTLVDDDELDLVLASGVSVSRKLLLLK